MHALVCHNVTVSGTARPQSEGSHMTIHPTITDTTIEGDPWRGHAVIRQSSNLWSTDPNRIIGRLRNAGIVNRDSNVTVHVPAAGDATVTWMVST